MRGPGDNLPIAPIQSQSRIEGGKGDDTTLGEFEELESGQIKVVTVVQQDVERQASDDMVFQRDVERGLVEDRRSVAEVSDGESRRKLVLKA